MHPKRPTTPWRPLAALLILAALAGCHGRGRGLTGDRRVLCEVTGAAGLTELRGDIAITCDTAGEDDDAVACTAQRVGTGGALTALDFGPVLRVQSLASGRTMVWSADGALAVHDQEGGRIEIAPQARDPWAADDRDAVVFVGPAEIGGTLEPGERRAVWLWDATSGSASIVVEDETAAQPVLVPGREILLYVTTLEGFADVARVDLSAPTRDLESDAEPTPWRTTLAPSLDGLPAVYGAERFFLDGHTLVFTAAYATDRVVRLDVDTGELVVLGDGRFPQPSSSGRVMAVVPSDACVQTYEVLP